MANRENDYYSWSSRKVRLRSAEITIFVKPGMADWEACDPARLLLAEHVWLDEERILLDLNCGTGIAGAAVLQSAPGTWVHAASSNALDLEATRRTLAAADRASETRIYPSAGTRAIPGFERADVVAVRLPKGKIPSLQLILDAYHALREGGRAYLAGGNSEGIKTYLRHMGDLFGGIEVLGYRKGHRVGVAVKASAPSGLPLAFREPWLDHQRMHRYQIEARGDLFEIVSRPGVFSWDRLDPGTQALVASMEVGRSDTVLDLGCGCGVVGFVAARMAAPGQVYLADASVDAVQVTRLGIAANQLDNCHVVLSDCAHAVRHLTFDVVATNPPFHQGVGTDYDVSRQFIGDAARLLRSGGRLYLVANRFLPYEAIIRAHFADMTVVHEDSRYKVLRAIR